MTGSQSNRLLPKGPAGGDSSRVGKMFWLQRQTLGGWRASVFDDDDACVYMAALLSVARLDAEGW